MLLDADYTGFSISAYDGTKTKNCSGGFYSTLVFNCSEDANWDSVSNGHIGNYVTAMPNEDDCEVKTNTIITIVLMLKIAQ